MPATAYAQIAATRRLTGLLDEPLPGGHLRLVSDGESDAASPIELPRAAAAVEPSTPHVGAFSSMDAQQRVSIAKAVTGLGWTEGSDLVIELVADGEAEVRPFDPNRQHPGIQATRLDRGRILLSSTVRAGLTLTPGAQVLAIALPEQQRVVLRNAAVAMAHLTGLVADCGHEQSVVPAAATSGPGTGPRAAWAPRPA